jgi:hypothetical protein
MRASTRLFNTISGFASWKQIAAAACLIGLTAAPARADDDHDHIVRVEEDWVLEILSPDGGESSPQLITAMSSTNQLADVHALFELNHRTLPDFTAGGMGLQLWSGDTNLDQRPTPKTEALHHANETIHFTMCLEIKDGNVEFEVRDGSSTSWGTFGGQGYLKTSASTTQNHLTLYSPTVSVKNSRVGFAKHRVKRFGILRVRYYSHGNVLESTDETDRMVHKPIAE